MTLKKVVKAGEIIGISVKNKEGESLGEIHEIIIDKTLGKISYLVLDYGGFFSIGNKFFAIPWYVFKYNDKQDCFILDINKDILKDAPGFNENNWPSFTAENVSNIDKYYQQ